MLFNSYEFICLFLPLAVIVFHLLARRGALNAALYWLMCASLFFYGWWNPAYLVLIVISILFNFSLGQLLAGSEPYSRRDLIVIAVCGNLALLGYFKYANFFVDVSNQAFGSGFRLDFDDRFCLSFSDRFRFGFGNSLRHVPSCRSFGGCGCRFIRRSRISR